MLGEYELIWIIYFFYAELARAIEHVSTHHTCRFMMMLILAEKYPKQIKTRNICVGALLEALIKEKQGLIHRACI